MQEPSAKTISRSIAVFGALMLGVIGNAIYDFFFKPGVGAVTNFVLNTIGSWSEAFDDRMYTNAALNPSSDGALFLMLLVAFGPTFFYFSQLGAWLGATRHRSAPPADRRSGRSVWRSPIALQAYLFIACAFLSALCMLPFMFINKSVWTWRAVQNDLKLCRPYLTDEQFIKVEAQVAEVQSKIQFLLVRAQLEKVAHEHKLLLTDERVH